MKTPALRNAGGRDETRRMAQGASPGPSATHLPGSAPADWAMTKIACIPVGDNRGLLSPVFTDFGRAPSFLLIDLATLAHRLIANHCVDGQCDPFRALGNVPVDVFIVGEICARSFHEIARREIAVYKAPPNNVAGVLAGYIAGSLARVGVSHTARSVNA